MEEPIDKRRLSDTQRAELLEDGAIRIIDDKTHKEIKLDVKAVWQLYELMHFHDKMSDFLQDDSVVIETTCEGMADFEKE